jgi:hypothetical protein
VEVKTRWRRGDLSVSSPFLEQFDPRPRETGWIDLIPC